MNVRVVEHGYHDVALTITALKKAIAFMSQIGNKQAVADLKKNLELIELRKSEHRK